jgi:hypothetical protein
VLAALGPHGYLVNVGRGTVVDTQALLDAPRAKRLAGAGLDVLEGEPGVPPLLPELLQCDNVVVTPHVADRGDRIDSRQPERAFCGPAAALAGLPHGLSPSSRSLGQTGTTNRGPIFGIMTPARCVFPATTTRQRPRGFVPLYAQGVSMAPDAFSEQRIPAQPLELDLTRTAVIVVDMVNEFLGVSHLLHTR